MKNIVSPKRGVTVAMAATMILIIALMTATITMAVVKTVKSSNLKAFATELSLVQNTIQEVAFTGSINEYLGQDVTLRVTNPEQFEGESIEDNIVLLHTLDLKALGIEKSVYGTGKGDNDKDYYAVSLETHRVYYVAGYNAGDVVYYALTDDLIELLGGQNNAEYNNNIVFKASTVTWTSSPVAVTVRVPSEVTISTVTVTTDNENIAVSTFTSKDGYNECVVNSANVPGNYVITVTYTLGGSQKTETYAITNYDNEAPTILMGSIVNNDNVFYLSDIRVIDSGKVKEVKYVEMTVEPENVESFFEVAGIDLVGTKVKLSSKDASFTIYAEDYAGNYTTSVVTIPDEFYYVGGTKDTGVVISDSADDENKGVDYLCTGNQFVWVPVDDYSKFVRGSADSTTNTMTGTLDTTTYVEPYTSGYSTEQEEYDAMTESVEYYGGFYIARFEAGKEDSKVVSKKNVTVYNNVSWGDKMASIGTTGAVYLSQQMYAKSSSVVSTLCYGVQWDAAMNFVSDTVSITDSSSWGNYSNNTADGHGSLQATGYSEAWKAKNIYDLAGNVYEWTMEANGSLYRVYRGGYSGNYGSSIPASFRAYLDPGNSRTYIGFRPTLYIKVPEKTAPVPSGFYYVGGTVRTGFVISDDASDENKGVDYLCAGNQFVWVPVDDYSTFKTGTAEETFSGSGIYKMTGTLGSTSGSDAMYYSWSYGGSTTGANGTAINSSEYNEMQASVKKYGGFYIARFEAGDSSAESKRTSSSEDGTLVSKKDVYPYTYVGWSDSLTTGSGASYALGARLAVGFSKNMYKNHESVVSTLCYGVQWDATMNFVSDKGHNIVDSTSWGNYYTTTGTASLQKTGSNEAWKAKEIYDLAGNAGEWTLETVSGPGFAANGSSGAPVYRGGEYSSTSSSLKSAARRYNGSFNVAYDDVAFRVALYLK